MAAFERELNLRPIELDKGRAEQNARWAEKTRDLSLQAAIELAFREYPANDDETKLSRLIAEHPGVSHAALKASRGKGDVGLVLAHFVYDRFGCFRAWIDDVAKMSNILFERDPGGASVRYRLTPEASAAFKAVRLV